MKKAFEQNVSRAKPRLRLGAFTGVVETEQPEDTQAPEAPAPEAAAAEEAQTAADLSSEVRARAQAARNPRLSMAEALHKALAHTQVPSAAPAEEVPQALARAEVYAPPVPAAHAEPLPEHTGVQTPAPPPVVENPLQDAERRRERLKERLKAVRENPRPEPLPPTSAEAGHKAVERITTLQAELTRVKAHNLSLTHTLENTRRQAEKATEEARLRMDEARRLAQDMEGRARLLEELEGELAALEGERDEALLSLQEVRQGLDAASEEKAKLQEEIRARDKALADSLAEEERLAGELEAAREESASLRRAVDALSSERDTLARQVADLTAERAELLEARKALEAVHRALSHATAH